MIRRAAVVTCILLLAACTDEPEPERDGEPSSPDRTSSAPAEADAVPLVLAVHATRAISDVPTAAARRLVNDGARRWSAIGQQGGRMDVVAAPGTSSAPGTRDADSARAALAAVRADDTVVGLLPASTVDASVRVLRVGGVHPLRRPAAYPLRTSGGTAPENVVTVNVLGDVMLGRRVGDRLRDDPAAVFRPLASRLAAADVTVGNLESTLSQAGSPTQGDDSFAADPAVGAGLRLAGFDVLSLANNHLGDYGETALRQTLKRVGDIGIETVGAGADRAAAREPVVVDAGGTRIGFYATDSIGETPAATPRTPGTNRLNMPPRTGPFDRAALRDITADLRRLAERVDTVVVIPHWGTQYTHVPEPSQRRAARAFARAGADLVAGGHPHWVQGWERAGEAIVAHSLGNFVFDMDFMRQTQEGVFLEAVLWDGEIAAVEPVPYVIGADFAPRGVRGERAQAILRDMWSTSIGPYAVP